LEGYATLWIISSIDAFAVSCTELTTSNVDEFFQYAFDGQMTRLMQLKHTMTHSEYRLAFEDCVYHLTAMHETFDYVYPYCH
jgi:hypothetical protein